jgi:hypothetical protein
MRTDFSLPKTTDFATLLSSAPPGEWQQRIRFNTGLETPGHWNSWEIADVLFHQFPESWWDRRHVLDIGANTGGLSLELIRRGANVTAVEPYAAYRNKIEWWRRLLGVPDHRLAVVNTHLFKTRDLGAFDVVLCLGLVYHFRHPQLVLDYVGNLDADDFVFSTQTWAHDQDVMINRSEITPQFLNGKPLGGGHFSRSLFPKMMSWAGFADVRLIDHPLVLHNWGEKPLQKTTNSAYYAAKRGTPVNVEAESQRFI